MLHRLTRLHCILGTSRPNIAAVVIGIVAVIGTTAVIGTAAVIGTTTAVATEMAVAAGDTNNSEEGTGTESETIIK